MRAFLVQVEAKHGPKVVWEGPETILGYYQKLGITAQNESKLLRLVKEAIQDDTGGELVKIEDMWVPDFEGNDAEILDLCGDRNTVGVWYQSGHAWFGPDEESEE